MQVRDGSPNSWARATTHIIRFTVFLALISFEPSLGKSQTSSDSDLNERQMIPLYVWGGCNNSSVIDIYFTNNSHEIQNSQDTSVNSILLSYQRYGGPITISANILHLEREESDLATSRANSVLNRLVTIGVPRQDIFINGVGESGATGTVRPRSREGRYVRVEMPYLLTICIVEQVRAQTAWARRNCYMREINQNHPYCETVLDQLQRMF
jgi:hypothetical protein